MVYYDEDIILYYYVYSTSYQQANVVEQSNRNALEQTHSKHIHRLTDACQTEVDKLKHVVQSQAIYQQIKSKLIEWMSEQHSFHQKLQNQNDYEQWRTQANNFEDQFLSSLTDCRAKPNSANLSRTNSKRR